MSLPTNTQIDDALDEAILRDAVRAAGKALQVRALRMLQLHVMRAADEKFRERQMSKLNEIRMDELRKAEWIERLERDRGLRGRCHPARLEPPEEADDADSD